MQLWRDHSRTIVGITLGSAALIASRLYWPEGGPDFDIATIPAGVILGIGLQGLIDMMTREVAKAEDEPLV